MGHAERILNVLPHYLVLLVLVFVGIGMIREFVGDLGFAVELVIVLAITLVYPPLVRRLGVAPDSWANG